MNERQQYEKHLAEKLQQLPPPNDEHRRWEQMRSLLDKEMPRGGGFGGNGSSGNGRWWITGIVAVMLMFGTWFTARNYLSGNKTGNPVAKATPNQKAANKETAPSSGVSLSQNQDAKSNDQPAANNAVAKENETAAANNVTTKENSANNKSSEANEVNATKNTEKAKNTIAKSGNTSLPVSKGKSNSNNKKNNRPDAGSIGSVVDHVRSVKTDNTKNSTIIASANRDGNRQQHNRPPHNNIADESLPSHPERVLKPSIVKLTIRYNDRIDPSPATVLGDTVEKSLVALLKRADSIDRATAAAKKPEKKKEDIGFASGFTLPLAFPLGDQTALGLNYKAGPNSISDYLPALHFQYHLNSVTYLQADIQPIAPQYIQPILLSQTKKEIPYTGTSIVTSYVGRKLYYLNLPVTIHHSPLKNFYMGAGLQFSHLISGIALADQRKVFQNGQDSIMSQQFFRFKNDSLSQMITKNELRLVLDVNYYWNRFTVGFRYTQAFGNFVNFQLGSFSPFTIEKNKSLQFYLGFNLWEDKKKKKSTAANKPLLTFK